MNQQHETIGALKDTVGKHEGEIASLKEELNRTRMLSGLGAWIEEARKQVLHHLKVDVSDGRYSEIRRKTVQMQRDDVKAAVKLLFDLNPNQWIRLSVDFYGKSRNTVIHHLPTHTEALGMLQHLPPQFKDDVDVFRQLLDRVNTNSPDTELDEL